MWNEDDDYTPGPPPDWRAVGLVHPRETTPKRLRRQERDHARTQRGSTGRGRARWASEILEDWGDLDCPRMVVPSSGLFREARKALGWTQPEAAWRLGFDTRTAGRIAAIEDGRRFPPRFACLLMVRALQDLAAQQRAMGGIR